MIKNKIKKFKIMVFKINNFLSKKCKKTLYKIKLKKNKYLKYKGMPKGIEKTKFYVIFKIKIIIIKYLVTKLFKQQNFLNDNYYRFLSNDKPNFIVNYFNARSSGKKLIYIQIADTLHKNTHMMQFVFLLEESNLENGCTVAVKKSHKSGKFSNRNSKTVIPIIGSAGDLIIWDSRLWHGTLENRSKQSRWAIVTTLSSWWVKQAMDMPKSLPKKIYKKCNNLQKQLLGFCSIPPANEKERINTKCGYEILR